MAKCWTVVAKVNINSQIPKGFTVTNVITQQNGINWPDLGKRLAEMGVKVGTSTFIVASTRSDKRRSTCRICRSPWYGDRRECIAIQDRAMGNRCAMGLF